MIPADVASRLRLVTPDQPAPTQGVAPSKQLTDVLSDLVPGQRIMAEIQSMLPNGAYRAMVAQREITLALPFSAKSGDALELEVVESDGKLSLAFVANRNSGQEPGKPQESVSATLSQTGKLIGNLLGSIGDDGKGSQPTPLNGNQPLLSEFPKDAAQLVPALKDALTSSGMFYEAHQARWAEGKLPTDALLQEPQGKLSSVSVPQHPSQLAQGQKDELAALSGQRSAADAATTTARDELAAQQKQPSQSVVPPDIAPLVRQQLDALATQNYVWQGQVWPGQQMYWEIEPENRDAQQRGDGKAAWQWRTRLKLTLPGLGGIDAVMRLRSGGAIDISLVTDSDESRQRLAAAGDGLQRKLADAGLKLAGLTVQHGESTD